MLNKKFLAIFTIFALKPLRQRLDDKCHVEMSNFVTILQDLFKVQTFISSKIYKLVLS